MERGGPDQSRAALRAARTLVSATQDTMSMPRAGAITTRVCVYVRERSYPTPSPANPTRKNRQIVDGAVRRHGSCVHRSTEPVRAGESSWTPRCTVRESVCVVFVYWRVRGYVRACASVRVCVCELPEDLLLTVKREHIYLII